MLRAGIALRAVVQEQPRSQCSKGTHSGRTNAMRIIGAGYYNDSLFEPRINHDTCHFRRYALDSRIIIIPQHGDGEKAAKRGEKGEKGTDAFLFVLFLFARFWKKPGTHGTIPVAFSNSCRFFDPNLIFRSRKIFISICLLSFTCSFSPPAWTCVFKSSILPTAGSRSQNTPAVSLPQHDWLCMALSRW